MNNQWEYRYASTTSFSVSPEKFLTLLNKLGQEGWEVVCNLPFERLLLKRQLDTEIPIEEER